MGFIKDLELPTLLLKYSVGDFYSLIGSDDNIKSAWLHLVLDYVISHLHGWYEIDDPHERCPLFELIHPVANSRLWGYDQMRSLDVLVLVKPY